MQANASLSLPLWGPGPGVVTELVGLFTYNYKHYHTGVWALASRFSCQSRH